MIYFNGMVKYLFFAFFVLSCSCGKRTSEVPEHFKTVDQMLWVIEDLDNVIAHWGKLGFTQVIMLDTVVAELIKTGKTVKIRLAKANEWCIPVKPPIVYEDHINKLGYPGMGMQNDAKLEFSVAVRYNTNHIWAKEYLSRLR